MARRGPTLRFQLLILGVGVLAIVVASFAADSDSERDRPTPGVATTTTRQVGFPAAEEGSVCRALITTEEAEALVGRPLEHQVIEPQNGQCAWPSEEGNPRNAELFFEVLPRTDTTLAEELASIFEGLPHRLDPITQLGEDAYFVTRLTAPQLDVNEDFVEGLYLYAGNVVVILANGGRHIWPGTDDEVKARLLAAMVVVLERITERLDAVEAGA